MNERAGLGPESDRDLATSDKPTNANVDPSVAAAATTRDPRAVASMIRQQPALKNAVFAMLQQSVGNHFVRSVVEILESGTDTGAPASGAMRVTADLLNVRNAPAKRDHNVVGTLQRHELVQASSREGDWLKLDYKGKPAYAFGDFLTPAKADHVESKQPVTGSPTPPAPTLAPPAHASADTSVAPTIPAPAAPVAAPTKAPAAADNSVAPTTPAPAGEHHEATPATHVDAAPPKHAETETKAPSYLASYHHLEGGGALDVDTTTDEEAKVLNHVRDDDRKLEPVYLKQLQNKLAVANKSGAFNTETLRALRKHYQGQNVDAETILKGDILTAILPGTPIVQIQSILGTHAQRDTSITPHTERKADAMARVAGYADYLEMQGQFTDIMLLDHKLGRGMPHLAQRVALADAFLRQRHPLDDQNKTWKQVARNKIGWDYTGQGAYGATANEIGEKGILNGHAVGPHMHSAGLALDIDVAHNPYVFTGGDMAKGSTGVDPVMTKHLERAAKMYGGEAVTPETLMAWTRRWSSEELFARVDAASKSLSKYLDLATKDDATITAALKEHGLPADNDSRDSVRRFRDFFKMSSMGRDQADGLTNHSMDMVVALRDVAGLAWGGAEMSERQNGDFMHFDLRNEKIGAEVHQFSLHNQDNTDDPKLADPPAKKKA
ncbi:MAG TPA: SH3 domain-containing protein [Kofleriaceae bacterium]|nr:SH3 domain-containing protein [Kofleriaceae bacterium]